MEADRKLLLWADNGSAVQTSRASDSAERYLRGLIFSGQLAPGDKLPAERELASRLGISRITLRAAIRSLEAKDFLVVRIGSKGGSWVNEAAAVTRCWEAWMQAHQDELDEMLEFLHVVETAQAALAAERRTEGDVAALASAMETPPEVHREVIRWHAAFHDALGRAAHNEYLQTAMRSIRSELFVPVNQVISERRIAEIQGVHEAVFEAVRDRDAPRAASSMETHTGLTRRLFEHPR